MEKRPEALVGSLLADSCAAMFENCLKDSKRMQKGCNKDAIQNKGNRNSLEGSQKDASHIENVVRNCSILERL